MFAKTSRGKRTAMNKVFALENASRKFFRDIEKCFQRTVLVTNIDANQNDGSCSARSGSKPSIKFLESYFRESRDGILEHEQDEKNRIWNTLFKRLVSDGFRVFSRLFFLYFWNRNEKVSSAINERI